MFENTLRVAQTHWAVRTFEENRNISKISGLNTTVEKVDVEWAYQYVYACLLDAVDLLGDPLMDSNSDNQRTEDIEKIIEIFQKAEGKWVSRRDIMRSGTKFTQKQLDDSRNGYLTYLIDSEYIEVVPKTEVRVKKSSRAVFYREINDELRSLKRDAEDYIEGL